jgi:hypothetical protein
MGGTIKLTIGKNGAVSSDMTGFKSCSTRTKEVLKTLDVQADSTTLKSDEVEVKHVSVAKQTVRK